MQSCGGDPLASSTGSIRTPGRGDGGQSVEGMTFSQSPAWWRLEEKAKAREW